VGNSGIWPIESSDGPMDLHQDNLLYANIINAKLNKENAALRSALKSARLGAKLRGITTREFAAMCAISPTQLSEWTSDPIESHPEFID
jgi:hypothetical protein